MKMMLDINIKSPSNKISYDDKLLIIGSCFTEHIGGRLHDLKFDTFQNPNGILFDPLSVSTSLLSYINNRQYKLDDLFFFNELWQSWQHHSMFSGIDREEVLDNINHSQQAAHAFIKQADWLIITLGSSFSYQLADTGDAVANCHRAPAQTFNKRLLEIEEIINALNEALEQLTLINPSINVILTVSPVRHIRDGVVENNRSKARLIEAVHHLVYNLKHIYYFPAYELVIDVLRDHRFYDIDLVHPNYAATEFVFEKFSENFIGTVSRGMMQEIGNVVTAFKHKAFQPCTNAHRSFLKNYLLKVQQLQHSYPHLDFNKEEMYFSQVV